MHLSREGQGTHATVPLLDGEAQLGALNVPVSVPVSNVSAKLPDTHVVETASSVIVPDFALKFEVALHDPSTLR